jgi:hypothetical protein
MASHFHFPLVKTYISILWMNIPILPLPYFDIALFLPMTGLVE